MFNELNDFFNVTVTIENIPNNCTEDELKDVFIKIGFEIVWRFCFRCIKIIEEKNYNS
jgi:hypothetical protein